MDASLAATLRSGGLVPRWHRGDAALHEHPPEDAEGDSQPAETEPCKVCPLSAYRSPRCSKLSDLRPLGALRDCEKLEELKLDFRNCDELPAASVRRALKDVIAAHPNAIII